jgi:hypothetical protein
MWLSKVAKSFQLPKQHAVEIFTDSINSQLLLSKKGGNSANRWLTRRYFFVKDAVPQGHVAITVLRLKRTPQIGSLAR